MDQLKTKEWWKAAGIRAVKTAAQSALGMLSVDGVGIMDVPWAAVVGVAALAAVYSLLTSLAGLPEVDAQGDTEGKED